MSEIQTPKRLQEFQEEIDKLEVTGGKANPERRLLTVGVILGVLGIILVVAAFLVSRSTEVSGNDALTGAAAQRDMIIMAILGGALVFVGAILYVTNKLTRFFRYWLVRLIYEHRAQTDRLDK